MPVQSFTSWAIMQANWELVITWVYDKPVDSGYMNCSHTELTIYRLEPL